MANVSALPLGDGTYELLADSARGAAIQGKTRVTRVLRTWWCAVNGGHYRVLHPEPQRLALKCVACGHSTPGWEVSTRPLVPSCAGYPERHRVQPSDA